MQVAIWTIKALCESLDRMQDNDFDCILFLEGGTGIGKSTLADHIARRIKAPYNIKTDLVYTREDTIKALTNKIKGVVVSDEMVNVAYNRDFFEQEQKVLIKALNMYRDSNNIFIGCIPNFADLDKQMKRLCKIRITVIRRGVALIHLKVKSLFTNDPWDTDANKKIERKWKRGKSPQYGKLSTVKGILYFSDMSEPRKKLYKAIKAEKRNKVYEEYHELQPKDKITEIYDNLFERVKEKNMTKPMLEDYARISGVSIKTMMNQLNLMLRNAGLVGTLKNYLITTNKKKQEPQITILKQNLPLKVLSSNHIKMDVKNREVWD